MTSVLWQNSVISTEPFFLEIQFQTWPYDVQSLGSHFLKACLSLQKGAIQLFFFISETLATVLRLRTNKNY